MNRKEFIILINSIGFKIHYGELVYKEFKIEIRSDYFNFYNGSEWVENISYTDLKPFEEYFKKELRSYKLKALLR